MSHPRILIVVTSHAELGETGQKTGFWLEELAIPYLELTRAGAAVDIASPLGGRPPVDPKSEKSPSAEVKEFLADGRAMAKLERTLRLEDVTTPYDAVLVAGGHGAMWDLAKSAALAHLLDRIYQAGGVVAAVCHGPAGLVGATKANGDPLVQDHRVAAFSNEEETAAGLDGVVPFLLETKLRDLGGRYERGPMWAPFVIRDGRLVTGQNPASSRGVAKETLAALETKSRSKS